MNQPHTAEPDYGTLKKTLSVYVTGIVLCIILTLIPFGVVMSQSLSKGQTFVIIFVSAVLQFLTQVICFLRLNTQNYQGKMNVMSFIFTIMTLFIIVIGSLWIMSNLNYNMMP